MANFGCFLPQIHEDTGASVSTKGVWYPDRSKATEKDPPLYIHISAHKKEILDKAIEKVNELIAIDMGSLVENKSDRPRERVCNLGSFLPPHSLMRLCNSANGPKKNSLLVLRLSGISTLGPRL